MNLTDVKRPITNLVRTRIITTRASGKIRSEDEMIILMKCARNRLRKSLESGRIEIVSEREWTLH